MGNEQSSKGKFNNADIVAETGLPEEVVIKLSQHFTYLSHSLPRENDSRNHDITIVPLTNEQFCSKFTSNRQIGAVLFNAMDLDRQGVISFRDFCIAVAHLSHSATEKDKIDFAFRCYDTERNGYVEVKDMVKIIQAFSHSTVRILKNLGIENPEYQSDESSAKAILEHIISIKKANESGTPCLGDANEEESNEYMSPVACDVDMEFFQKKQNHRISKNDFACFCRESPEVFRQMNTAHQCLQSAALVGWEGKTGNSEDGCIIM